jgi:formylglycine-generating enzyme required for sulfatase activity
MAFCALTLLGTLALAAFESELPVKRPAAPKPVPKTPPAPTYRAGQVFNDCSNCPDMVVIPSGSFLMGSPGNDEDGNAQRPQRTVNLRMFAIGKTEVTQKQYNTIMGNNPSNFPKCGDDCPVEQISWNDAQEYIKKLNAMTGKTYSLPSEAQWEYAARAGTTTAFHTGNTITTDQANYFGSLSKNKGIDRNSTIKVASLNSPNAFGLHDMHGNVFE